jgi:hypothetical protein
MYLELCFAEWQHRWILHIFSAGQSTSTHHWRLNAVPTNCFQGRNNIQTCGCHLTMIWMCVLFTSRDTWQSLHAFWRLCNLNLKHHFLKNHLTLSAKCHRISRIDMKSMCCFRYLLQGPFQYDISNVVLMKTFSKYGPKLQSICVAAWFSNMTEPDTYKFPTLTEPKVSLVCSEETISGACSQWNACSPCPQTPCAWEPLQYYFSTYA